MRRRATASVILLFFMLFAICDAGNHLHAPTVYLFGVLGVGAAIVAIVRRRRL